MKKISNKIHQGTLTTVIIIIVFGNISSGISLNPEKYNGPPFSNFNHFHPYRHPLQRADDKNQFHRLNMVLSNRSAPLFLNFS